MIDQEFKTPMLKQYLDLKQKYPDALLFFRLGDFYELFFDDAKLGAEIMNITLTRRSRGADGQIPMCGVPYHAVDNYLGKIVKAGYKVAIAEQVTEASDQKGLVERKVIRVITPGTVMSEKLLDQKENNFLLCLEIQGKKLGFAFADLGTGLFQIHEIPFTSYEKDLPSILNQIHPAELLLPPHLYDNVQVLKAVRIKDNVNVFLLPAWDKYATDATKYLKNHFHLPTLRSFGIEEKDYSVALPCAANLLFYLQDTQKNELPHITKLSPYSSDSYLKLDNSTLQNLEIFKTVRTQAKKGSLLYLLDMTHTAMGARLLRNWLARPLSDKEAINSRLEIVAFLLQNASLREALKTSFSEIIDMERLLSRLSLGLGSPRDLDALKNSLSQIVKISSLLDPHSFLSEKLPLKLSRNLEPLISYLDHHIETDPPFSTKEGGFIKDSVDEKLDDLRSLLSGDKKWLFELEASERQKTGIDSLKIKANQVYGYYLEISKANLSLVPAHYLRKQTLVNAERFTIPELKMREDQVFAAEDQIRQIEYRLFQEIIAHTLEYLPLLQDLISRISVLDCLLSFAQIAESQNYIKPEIIDSGDLIIRDGRHPVVQSLLLDREFIPNDTEIRTEDSLLLLITGPNMSGKSTYLRQVALITMMAHLGSFVPARKAIIPLTDQIFTRVGASDSLAEGESTFLVEMIETSQIINNATPKSLVIFDEVGRGTSTFDGMSLAWSIIEYLLSRKDKRPRTLFATHYHELTVLADKYSEIKNMQMAVTKEKDEIIFLRKVTEGAQWESYGIEVAKMAGLPNSVVKRAQEILYRLKANQATLRVNVKKIKDDSGQMKLV